MGRILDSRCDYKCIQTKIALIRILFFYVFENIIYINVLVHSVVLRSTIFIGRMSLDAF